MFPVADVKQEVMSNETEHLTNSDDIKSECSDLADGTAICTQESIPMSIHSMTFPKQESTQETGEDTGIENVDSAPAEILNKTKDSSYYKEKLQQAISKVDLKNAEALLEHFCLAGAARELDKDKITLTEENQFNILTQIINRNCKDLLKLFLTKGLKVSYENLRDYPISVVQEAIKANKCEMVELLLTHGADVNFRVGRNYQSLLYESVKSSYVNVVKVILNNGATKKDYPALYQAIEQKNIEILKLLLSSNAMDVNCTTGRHNFTPFHEVIRTKNVEMFYVMLKNGADLSVDPATGEIL